MTSHRTACHIHKSQHQRAIILFCVALFSSASLFTPSESYANHSPDHSGSIEASMATETNNQNDDNKVGAAKGCATGAAVGTALAPGVGTVLGCIAMGVWGWLW